MSQPLLVIISGAMANKHLNGGEAWVRLNWVLGLRQFGCEVYFIEQIASDTCVDEHGAPAPVETSANVRYFTDIMRMFDLEPSASLIVDGGTRTHGLSYADVLKVASAADVLINISGHLTLAPILERVRETTFIDLDPGFTQFWHAQGLGSANLLGHDFYFTVGENIGTAACPIPTCGVEWHRKPRFVVLNQWPLCADGDRNRFTTVAAWRGAFGAIEHRGRRYGLKVHEFRKIISLPTRAPQRFEIALSIHPADSRDREALIANGWNLVDPRTAAADPFMFRRYLQGSGGECSAAQGIYVETNSGWLSDRTVRYLASGKPALVQDTGFSRNYPVGHGLVPFRTLDEAVAGAESIFRDYDRHARAARALAETYFDSAKVLPQMFNAMGLTLSR